MEVFLTVLHIFLCFFLLLVVLLQPGKGADFGAAMGGASNEVLGAAGSVSLLAKVTTLVAAMFMGTSLGLAWFSNAPERSFIGGDELEQELQELRESGGAEGSGTEGSEGTDAEGTGSEAAPAEGEAAPAGDEAAPAEGEAAPAEGEEAAPAEGEAAPAEGEAAPAEGEAAPAEGETAPAEAPADE